MRVEVCDYCGSHDGFGLQEVRAGLCVGNATSLGHGPLGGMGGGELTSGDVIRERIGQGWENLRAGMACDRCIGDLRRKLEDAFRRIVFDMLAKRRSFNVTVTTVTAEPSTEAVS
jgi:hypothetical protein